MSDPPSIDRARWARVSDLFDRALVLPPGERAAWLDAACGGDRALFDEVMSLIGTHERAGTFIDRPAFEAAAIGAGASAPPPSAIGPYRIVRVLGEGGMAVVYLAEDERLGRLVALKAVAPVSANDRSRIDRLRKEARAAAGLDHPNIATVYALEEIDGQWYMASEYLQGETLRQELARGPLETDRALITASMIARALAAAHERGVVHRDLKPENIMRTPEGVVKILDFGLARIVGPTSADATLTADGAVLGTPAYMSPEQIRGNAVDARSDLFSLGIVLHELLTGSHPFPAPAPAATLARILEDEPDSLSLPSSSAPPDPHVVSGLSNIVSHCLAKAPDDRFQSALELAEALEAVRGSAGTDMRVAGAAESTIRRHRISSSPRTLWWWQFHQIAATISYLLLLVPLWHLRDLTLFGPNAGFFFAGLISAVAAGAIRLHLWFALRLDPAHWVEQHTVSRRWLRAADIVFSLVLLGEGVTAIRADDPAAILLVAAAAAVTVSYGVIEPATTRAAIGQRGGSS